MPNMHYTVDPDTFHVRVYNDESPNESGAPFLFQPDWPNGDAWATKAQATAWAEAVLASYADETAPLPGPNAANPTQPRPDPVPPPS